MPKKKFLLSEGKHKGKKPVPAPQTADEFLASGVELEESGEKWRAGDAAKSARFFIRAIDAYKAALQKFPTSFDIAYNLYGARLRLELSQQPRLLEHLPTTLLDLLRLALDSHRYALSLNGQDANALFNIAQVLRSIAEIVLENTSEFPDGREEALGLFRDAFLHQEECLKVQQALQLESINQQAAFAEGLIGREEQDKDKNVAANAATPASPASSDGQWASVVEPVTSETLLETETALLQTLTDIVPLVAHDQDALQTIESTASRFLGSSDNMQADTTSTIIIEHHQHQANLHAALSDASFRLSLISAEAYSSALTNAFSFPLISTFAPALCDSADASIAFSLTLSSYPPSPSSAALRWKHLTSALAALSSAATASNASAIHGRRAEAELLRARLGEEPDLYALAATHRATLLKNAETYYRGAAKLAAAEGEQTIEKEMSGRESVVRVLLREGGGEAGAIDLDAATLRRVLAEMKEDGLVGDAVHFSAGGHA